MERNENAELLWKEFFFPTQDTIHVERDDDVAAGSVLSLQFSV